YTHTPENINGTWDISTKLNSSVTTKIKTHEFRFKIKANGSYNRMKNFVIDNTTNMTQEVDNNEINLSLMPLNVWTKIFWNKIDVTGSATFNWRKSLNTMVNAGYSNALESKYELSIRTDLPLHIRLDSEISAVKRRGYSNDELNKLACEWDVSLSKSILKNKINLNLKAIDLLHQYKAVTYTTNERGICETHAVTLPAYALFTVSFNFSKFPTNFNRYDYMNQ
ncbi:MAG: outer membrane beta-barrel protein, partial [Bacteroidaceae bacterium]|nr:outer membrane beta-barrel protein [Bacteroidaceae bacterium]